MKWPVARSIDLNADLGEDPEALRDGREEALLAAVTSANVACGGHAGDETTMREVVEACLRRGVAVGAHPSYPDRLGFGRAEMDLPPTAIERAVADQVAALASVLHGRRDRIRHVKPHGALYHAASRLPEVAEAIARGVERALGVAGREVVLVGQAGRGALLAWRRMGRRVAAEAFADRRYEADGSLRSRALPEALLRLPSEAAEQAVAIARGEGVVAADGSHVAVEAETICLHGDTPGAAAIARAVRARLEGEGFLVRALRGPSGA